jgi:hypothetical protein
MTRAEYIRTARTLGADLADYAARVAGVSLAIRQLWALQAAR